MEMVVDRRKKCGGGAEVGGLVWWKQGGMDGADGWPSGRRRLPGTQLPCTDGAQHCPAPAKKSTDHVCVKDVCVGNFKVFGLIFFMTFCI